MQTGISTIVQSKMAKKNILIAEDRDFLADIIETCLSGDCKCFKVQTGPEALAISENIDCAVISTNVQGIGNVELLRGIKEKFAGIPVVILTTNTTSMKRIMFLKEGADDVMTKPFNPDELALRVKRLLK